jgi:ribosomal protein S18 acetylase RimI-like enzyme
MKPTIILFAKKELSLLHTFFMSYGDVYEGEGYINEVYVIPTERKKGIAKKLIEKSIAWLKQHNCSKIDITVNRKNKNALELYKKYGFKKFEDNYISMRKNI